MRGAAQVATVSSLPPIDHSTLAGAVAIVTGGGRGIGRAIALELARAGAAVAVLARTAAEIDATVRIVEDIGGRATGEVCDVADLTAVRTFVEGIEESVGPVSLLVNNAATLAAIGPFWETDPSTWRKDIDSTLFGTVNCCWAVLQHMVARRRGRIINISSMNAVWGLRYTTSYDCAKTSQLRLTEGLAGELAPHSIQIFAVAPGPVRTAMSEASADPSVARWMNNRGFLFDIARDPIPAETAARTVVYLATGYADRLTGRFVTVQDDLAALVAAADTIRDDELLTLRLESIHGMIRSGHRTADHYERSP